MTIRTIILLLFAAGLAGCNTFGTQEVESDPAQLAVNERISVCSAGFSTELKAELKANLNESLKSGAIEATAVKQSTAAIFKYLDEGDRLEAYQNYLSCMQVEPNPKVVQELTEGELRTQAAQLQFAKNVCMGEDVDFSIAQDALSRNVTSQGAVSMESVTNGMAGQIQMPITESERTYNAYVSCLTTVFRSLG